MQRYLSVDILRGVAILLMIQVHFVDNLSSSEESSAWLYKVSGWLGMLPAPLFTFLSGLSVSLWIRKQQAKGESDDAITKVLIRRGLFLFGAGTALNFFVWFPEETFNWDILTLLGVSMMILAYARKLLAEVLGLVCLMVLLLTPPLRVMCEFAAYWEDGVFVYDIGLRDVLLGFLVNGYFPLLPWLIFPLIGFIVGETALRHGERFTSSLVRLAAIGIGLMTLAALGLLFRDQMPNLIAKHYAEGFTMYPASTEYTLGMMGFSIFFLALLHRWIDQSDRKTDPGATARFLQRWSSWSLTAYVLHQIIHLWPLWVYGVWMGHDDPTFYWRKAMSTPAALSLAMAFIVLSTVAMSLLEHHKKYSFESVMRWTCD